MTAYPLTESGARYIAELLLQRAQALTYLEPRDSSIFGALPIPILVDSVVDLAKSGADAFDMRGVVIATLITLGLGAPKIARAESVESGTDASGDVRDDAASGEEGLPPTAARAAELRLDYRKRLEALGLPLQEITRKALENYERSGQFPEALVNASTLLYLDATDADAIFAFCRNLSRIAETDEHPEVALAVTERALALLPDHIDLLDIAASLAYNRGDDETATRHWNHAYHCAVREGGDDSEMIHRLYSNWKSAENRGKLTRAFALGDRGRISEAMPLLRELEPIFSDYWLFCHYYGVA
ncbi:MAG: hypothetical protein Q4A52_06545, partial [Bacillota bacterium]|nr:hypothetical protein [Bacillota bacterium]